ncbi:MAG TPA: hypothetical protein DD373_00050, partial [Halomonas sp.]|nr:hypothetical protein [Halomonas sp.]
LAVNQRPICQARFSDAGVLARALTPAITNSETGTSNHSASSDSTVMLIKCGIAFPLQSYATNYAQLATI